MDTGLAGKGAENGLGLSIIMRSTLYYLYTAIGLLGCRNQACSVGRGVWIEQDTNLGQVWLELLQELDPFSSDSKIPNHEPSDIATGVAKTFRQSKSNGIDQLGKNDGDSGRQLAKGESCRQTLRINNIGLERYQFGCGRFRFG